MQSNNNETTMTTPDDTSQGASQEIRVTEYDDGVSVAPPPNMPAPPVVVPGDDIAGWFKRPRLIEKFTWADGTNIQDHTFDPWELYMANAQVKKKAENYRFFRGNLHLKFVVNAQPFQAGALMVTYKPLAAPFGFDGIQDVEKLDFSGGTVTLRNAVQNLTDYERTAFLSTISTRPHVFLTMSDDQGAEMSLPYINYRDWSVIYDSDYTTAISEPLGKISVNSFAILRSTTVATSATITVYAWFDSIELAVPTAEAAGYVGEPITAEAIGFLSAAASFFHFDAAKPISSVFSAISNIGRTVVTVASTVADAAAKLGFSKTPFYTSASIVGGNSCQFMSSTTVAPPTDVLALNPEARILYDPTHVGLPNEDAMTYQHILSHIQYLGKFQLIDTQLENSIVFRVPVTPDLHYRFENIGIISGTAKYHNVFNTVGSFLADSHMYWSGPIVFKFKLVCTKYIKGRLLVTFDPAIDSVSAEIGTQMSKVVDISENGEFEIEAPFAQTNAWASISRRYYQENPTTQKDYIPYQNNGSTNQVTFAGTANEDLYAGFVNVSVVNPIRSNEVTTTVDCLVFVDFSRVKFAVPTEPRREIFFGDPETGTVATHFHSVLDMAFACSGEVSTDDAVYNGDPISSIKALLQRSTYIRSEFNNNTDIPVGKTKSMWVDYPTAFVPPVVFSTSMAATNSYYDTLKPCNGTLVRAGNVVPYLNFTKFAGAYIGWAGSTEYRLSPSVSFFSALLSVVRGFGFSKYNQDYPTTNVAFSSTLPAAPFAYNNFGRTPAGCAVGDQTKWLVARVPYMSRDKMRPGNSVMRPPPLNSTGYVSSSSGFYKIDVKESVRLSCISDASISSTARDTPNKTHVFFSSGDDFVTYGFLNPPTFSLFVFDPASLGSTYP
jgi:hypothetical protein